jgi:S-methylmethionine-dependent homocysteine/selenocysteine methylase
MAAEYNDGRGRRSREDWAARLARGHPVVLDGATGTELERMGYPTGLPLWSTHALLDAPNAVADIHRRYRAAGAEVITADTFRTQRRTLARAGLEARDFELTELAIGLARAAGAPWVAGSAPTLEDCYRPDLVPGDDDLRREHGRHAANLARAGADLILCETLNTTREARAACRAARATGLPFCASFVSWQDARILSGESLADATRVAIDEGAQAVLVNCLPPSAVAPCLPVLGALPVPFGVYANLGQPDDEVGLSRSEDCTPDDFARHAGAWIDAGARLVGGCCGTTPDHIRAVALRACRSVSPEHDPGHKMRH